MSKRHAVRAFLALGLLPGALQAAVFTVGPGGTHATVGAAMDAARLAGGDDEVRIAQGIWPERVGVADTSLGRLDVSGGWNATFDVQTLDPALTVIDGEHAGVAFAFFKLDGIATLRNLTFARGRSASGQGASLVLGTLTFASIELSDCVIRDGEASAPANQPARGGGAYLSADHSSEIVVQRCVVRDNLLQAQGESAWGSGLSTVPPAITACARARRPSMQASRCRPAGWGQRISMGSRACAVQRWISARSRPRIRACSAMASRTRPEGILAT